MSATIIDFTNKTAPTSGVGYALGAAAQVGDVIVVLVRDLVINVHATGTVSGATCTLAEQQWVSNGASSWTTNTILTGVVTVAGTPTVAITSTGGLALSWSAYIVRGLSSATKNGGASASGTSDPLTAAITTNTLCALFCMYNNQGGGGFTAFNGSITSSASGSVYAYGYQLNVASGAQTPGVDVSSAEAGNTFSAIYLPITPTDPTITGGTAAPIEGSTGNTITGTLFGASQTGPAALVIGGTGQTETAWSATGITYTAVRGVNLNGVAVNAVVTDSAGASSAGYALTGFEPPAGYEYVTLTSVNSTAAYRITAIADLAIGNQLEWDEPLVTINPDGSYVADPSVTSFNVRVGVTTDGWGSLAVQNINAASGGSGGSIFLFGLIN